ncbi:transcriptional regulator, TetR family [Paenibacillus curdlanolyticus YK9]|uniref:Transcriptional regulator, TetR family n=1 Tax=Paenibacillus curdlanolyticus YK9 TaxID=717606 RepID=E0IEN5_9BACL|nr:TetR/AcrR family transcriptional regulator [Paenibacillus curdlanolyticus]EFM09123.1 transcriptional regulator, TetR family [Paenibacillus curdlanolyticus YK9]
MNDTALRIKQTALRLFTEYGFEGTSMSDIAKEVGIKTPSIYAHYESKEQLFIRLIEEVIGEEQASWMAMMERSNALEQSAQAKLKLFFEFFTDFNQLSIGQTFLKRTVLVPPRGLVERIRKDLLAYEDTISAHLLLLLQDAAAEAGAARVDGKRLLAVFYALIDGLLVEYQLYDTDTHRERTRLAWEWFWDGIKRGE